MARPVLPGARLPMRWAAVGAAVGALLGALAGLVIGLDTHWRTAWFAVLELGLPSLVVGCVLGLWLGALVVVGRRLAHRDDPRDVLGRS